ncbi:MAG: hypothetical protein JKY88_00725 [Pseudomonadales bacterium]|nr:hypothetical protein [Pseudomonadales bacterium]
MSELLHILAQFRVEIVANQRLRWGLFLIAVIAGFYFVLVVDDYRVELNAEFDSLNMRNDELLSLESESVWRERMIIEENALKEMEVATWQAESESLVRAEMQSTISSFAQKAGLEKFNLKVGSFQPHPVLSDVSVVRFELDAAFTDDSMLDFVSDLESNTPIFKVSSMTVRSGTKRSRLQMMILAYYNTRPANGELHD